MYTLFPVPIIFVAIMMIKKRVFDLLSIILITFTLVIATYVVIGWPEWPARITMMSFSTATRATDIILLAQVFILVRAMSRFTQPSVENVDVIKLKPLVLSSAAAMLLMYFIERFSRSTLETPLGFTFLMVTTFGIAAILYSIFDLQRNKKVLHLACIYLIVISFTTLISIHPIMKGLDAIYAKPLAAKVSELAEDPAEKWISLDGIVGSSYLIATGASTISSTSFYPNLDLWHKLDTDRKYEHIYNRYSHITVSLTSGETSFELYHLDHVHINLSAYDLATAGVKFIHTPHPLETFPGITFTLLYNEDNALIYAVNYDG
jgi:hypothetical protein